jgi:hypothetical protein
MRLRTSPGGSSTPLDGASHKRRHGVLARSVVGAILTRWPQRRSFKSSHLRLPRPPLHAPLGGVEPTPNTRL